MSLDARERHVTEEIERRSDELVVLAADLVRFDTTTRAAADDPPREEAALQRYLASRLETADAEAELWEPSPDEVPPSKIVPAGLGFEGRPASRASRAPAPGAASS